MAQELFRFRLITNNTDAEDWYAGNLREHLHKLTGVQPQVEQKNFTDVNPATHTAFEVRIREDLEKARNFLLAVRTHHRFRIEQL